MTSKGSISGQLDRAIAAGQTLAVRGLAAELPQPVSLKRAVAITLMFLEHEPESYPAAARRLVAKIATERAVALSDLAEAGAILDHLQREPIDTAARADLLALVERAPRSIR